MQCVILAGGLGARLSEETHLRPKPMVEIGDLPILWHIMEWYAKYDVKDFIICAGYKGYVIKEYFLNYSYHNSDLEIDLQSGEVQVLKQKARDWRVKVINTGLSTMTGGRLRAVADFLDDEFFFTYGDGLSNIDLHALHRFHASHGKMATVTGVRPPGRFGALDVRENGEVTAFEEKPVGESGWINGGFFVLHKSVVELVEGPDTIWEREPMESLAAQRQLRAYRHEGFWHPMDTLRDKRMLEAMWQTGQAPWKP